MTGIIVSGIGMNGSVWYTGSGPPDQALGVFRDFYLDSNNGDYYRKGAVWELEGNLKGPQGDPGAPGVTGPQGPQGVTGPAGGGGGSGSVSYVGLTSLTSIATIANSPITTSGVLSFDLVTQAANTVLAGPTTSTAIPTFRTIDLNTLSNVSVSMPQLNDLLIYNGTYFVNGPSGTNFTFSVSTFTDNQTNTQLIGSGTWVATGGITFAITYVNGPPDSASIALSSTGGVTWSSPLTVSTPFTSAASAQNTSYPSAKDTTVTFTLTAIKGSTTDSTKTQVVTFRNYVSSGVSNTASGYTSGFVNALTGVLSNSKATSVGLSPSASQYLIFAYPTSYGTISNGNGAANGFIYNSVTCAFENPETVSVTNSAGFVENYYVYRSTLTNLGSSTLTTSTGDSRINRIYYGVTTTTSGYTESDIEGLGTSVVSNTKGRTITPTVGSGQYVLYCLPVRLGTVTFSVDGFGGGFQAPETVSVTNVNGFTEDYYAYRSTNSNLGTPSIVVT